MQNRMALRHSTLHSQELEPLVEGKFAVCKMQLHSIQSRSSRVSPQIRNFTTIAVQNPCKPQIRDKTLTLVTTSERNQKS
jgi:hypothetical protein